VSGTPEIEMLWSGRAFDSRGLPIIGGPPGTADVPSSPMSEISAAKKEMRGVAANRVTMGFGCHRACFEHNVLVLLPA